MFEPDGSLVIYRQHDSLGTGKEANWFPIFDGPVFEILRLYGPHQVTKGAKFNLSNISAVSGAQLLELGEEVNDRLWAIATSFGCLSMKGHLVRRFPHPALRPRDST